MILLLEENRRRISPVLKNWFTKYIGCVFGKAVFGGVVIHCGGVQKGLIVTYSRRRWMKVYTVSLANGGKSMRECE